MRDGRIWKRAALLVWLFTCGASRGCDGQGGDGPPEPSHGIPPDTAHLAGAYLGSGTLTDSVPPCAPNPFPPIPETIIVRAPSPGVVEFSYPYCPDSTDWLTASTMDTSHFGHVAWTCNRVSAMGSAEFVGTAPITLTLELLASCGPYQYSHMKFTGTRP